MQIQSEQGKILKKMLIDVKFSKKNLTWKRNSGKHFQMFFLHFF